MTTITIRLVSDSFISIEPHFVYFPSSKLTVKLLFQTVYYYYYNYIVDNARSGESPVQL